MEYVNLIGGLNDTNEIKSFAEAFFAAAGVTRYEGRESSNYVDEQYFVGSRNQMKFKIALSDDESHRNAPYWIQVSSNGFSSQALAVAVDDLVRSQLIPAGFRVYLVSNFGKRGEKLAAY